MRHLNAGKKLGRNTSHRRALLRNLVTSLVLEERISTTVPKAKAIRPLAERMVTLGKRGSLHARRQAASYLLDAQAVHKLFDQLAARFGDRAGGYTRIVKTGFRHGDNASLAYIEFLGSEGMQAAKRKRRSELLERKAEAQKKASEEMGEKKDQKEE
ncbi:MAG: 50S ribosomal protein L17 [Acidobacteria bacterium]|nr:MAG: 50S ribosomal protein L17 [Acidobacteriota bacterium]